MRNFAQFCNKVIRTAIADANAAIPSRRAVYIERIISHTSALGIYLDERMRFPRINAGSAISKVSAKHPEIVSKYVELCEGAKLFELRGK